MSSCKLPTVYSSCGIPKKQLSRKWQPFKATYNDFKTQCEELMYLTDRDEHPEFYDGECFFNEDLNFEAFGISWSIHIDPKDHVVYILNNSDVLIVDYHLCLCGMLENCCGCFNMERSMGEKFYPKSFFRVPDLRWFKTTATGALIIEGCLNKMENPPETSETWFPPEYKPQLLLNYYKKLPSVDGNTATPSDNDADDESDDGTDYMPTVNVIAEAKSVHFHKLALKETAKELFQRSQNREEVPLDDDTKAVTLESIRTFIYKGIDGFEEGLFENYEETIDMLIFATKYAFIDLKLLIESALVKNVLDEATCLPLLHHAKNQTCPLLKEACTEYFKANFQQVVNNENYEKEAIDPSVISELLKEFSQSLATGSSNQSNCDPSLWSVGKLRDEIFDKTGRLSDLDGTKNSLLNKVKELSNSNRKRPLP